MSKKFRLRALATVVLTACTICIAGQGSQKQKLDQEYAGTQKTLAGCDLVQLSGLLFGKDSYLVAGNFYDEEANAHVALGPGEVLSKLGYHT